MKHTYNMIGYAKQLQNDYKEFSGVDVSLDEIIKEHDLKPSKLYVTNNELVLLEVLENEKRSNKMKEKTIAWLENNQQNGAFENQPEDDMDFNNLSEDEIEWYYQNWVLEEEKEQ